MSQVKHGSLEFAVIQIWQVQAPRSQNTEDTNRPWSAISTPSAHDKSSYLNITRRELQVHLMIPVHHLLKDFQKYFILIRLATIEKLPSAGKCVEELAYVYY